jgi:hypothetical protein
MQQWYPGVQEVVPKVVISIVGNKIDQRKYPSAINSLGTSKEGMEELKGLKCIRVIQRFELLRSGWSVLKANQRGV